MVYVNSKKYACESCIKGHRSSSCHHNDRPLFEIKKKGRPVTQCEKCREARQARRIHAKCLCESERSAHEGAATGDGDRKKGKRFIPSVPSLPNGLKDVLKASSPASAETSGPRQPVDALLNPCHCKDVYTCKCRPRAGSSISLGTRPSRPVDPAIFSDGLSALALVAACCSPATPCGLPSISPSNIPSGRTVLSDSAAASRLALPALSSHVDKNSDTRPTGTTKRKRLSHSPPVPRRELLDVNQSEEMSSRSIAPAQSGMDSAAWAASLPSYVHPPAPSSGTASTVTSHTARDADRPSCCCGTRCECAGCSLHGPPSSVDRQPSWVDDPAEAGPSTVPSPVHTHGADCATECPTCIDYDGGFELPPLSGVPGVASSKRAPAPPFLAAFLARAAALPAPPAHARSSLDPMNVIVYPTGLFKRLRRASESVRTHEDERPRGFGLVRIPKLEECCGGRCGCAEAACGCGEKCDGCCMEGGDRSAEGVGGKDTPGSNMMSEGSRLSPSVSFARQSQDAIPPPVLTPSAGAAKACCGRC